MTDLFVKLKIHKKQNLPFVLYSKPNSNKTIALFQNNDCLYPFENINDEGFVFTSFDKENAFILPNNFVDTLVEVNSFVDINTSNLSNILDTTSTHKKTFINLVEKAKIKIKEGYCEKIVVSRKESITIDSFDIEKSFKKMLSLYPSAFKYCYFHPKVGLWIGATPEQLLKINSKKFQTVALAGTRLVSNDIDEEWGEKEVKEQKFVTDFILENIKDEVEEETVSTPYTITAGNIQHIKTDIEATLKSENNFENILEALHPTPAVCGYPKKNALDFILENEIYDRNFYSGYLGELNMCFETGRTLMTDLYVNLRCMQIKDTTAEIYVGCGITSESDPELEFEETKNKTITMKKIV